MQKIIVIAALVLAACGGEGDDTIEFDTGEFTIHTNVVDDQCLDGGLNLLFMPDGVDTPWEWPFPIKLHGEDELPTTYDIQLREPFGKMTVEAQDAGVNLQSMSAEGQQDVLLGEASFGACVVDMEATVQVQIVDGDSADGLAEITLKNPRGDDRCPTDMPASCRVLLSFDANRE